MHDILLSVKQYQAVLERLDEITKDVSLIKDKTLPEAGYIDNHDLLILLQVNARTLYRWRKKGLLPYRKLGTRFYYRADLIMKRFKMQSDEKDDDSSDDDSSDDDQTPPAPPIPDENELNITCKRCPLFVIFNSED